MSEPSESELMEQNTDLFRVIDRLREIQKDLRTSLATKTTESETLTKDLDEAMAVVETYDERFSTQHDEHRAKVERLRELLVWLWNTDDTKRALVCDEEIEIDDIANAALSKKKVEDA